MSKAPLGSGSSAQTGHNLYAPLDVHERHAVANPAAEQARIQWRAGQ